MSISLFLFPVQCLRKFSSVILNWTLANDFPPTPVFHASNILLSFAFLSLIHSSHLIDPCFDYFPFVMFKASIWPLLILHSCLSPVFKSQIKYPVFHETVSDFPGKIAFLFMGSPNTEAGMELAHSAFQYVTASSLSVTDGDFCCWSWYQEQKT